MTMTDTKSQSIMASFHPCPALAEQRKVSGTVDDVVRMKFPLRLPSHLYRHQTPPHVCFRPLLVSPCNENVSRSLSASFS